MSNTNDQLRKLILQYFYDRNQNATSEKGQRGSHVKISDVKKELKKLHGLTQKQVMSQLNYLISSGWVSRVSEERTFRTPRGTQQPSLKEWYVISASGMDKIEGSSSEFVRQSPYSNINITAVNSAVQLGSGNVVQESFVGLANELEELAKSVVEADLSDEDKISIVADIETINGQLAKPEPNKDIVRTAWRAITSSKAAMFITSVSAIVRAMDSILG